jgi:hypothetical protein
LHGVIKNVSFKYDLKYVSSVFCKLGDGNLPFKNIGGIIMENEQFTTLVNTLLNNNLASNQTEARRMAEEMIGTSQKVQDSFKKEKHTFMVSNYTARQDQLNEELAKQPTEEVWPKVEQEPMQNVPASNNESMQRSIQELRERAINPQPVHIQVDFQTPQTDLNSTQLNSGQETAQTSTQLNSGQETAQTSTQLNNNQFNSEQVSAQTSTQIQDRQATTQQPTVNVHIPGVATDRPISELLQEATMPNEEPTREKDDFLTVREQQDAQPQQQEQQAPAFAQQAPQQQQQTNTSSFGGLSSGFPEQQAPQQQTQEIPSAQPQQQEASANTPQRKEDLWTPEERQLREDCDLSKVFNFSGK